MRGKLSTLRVLVTLLIAILLVSLGAVSALGAGTHPVSLQRAPAAQLPWDTGAWAPLFHGLDSAVDVLAVSGADLYVGGSFVKVCADAYCEHSTLTVNRIAKWDGSAWSALGNGLNGTVAAMVVSGTDLYVGGWFNEICGNAACDSGNTPANHVAKWDGTAWSALNPGLNGSVSALAVSGSALYAGGAFTRACLNAVCDTAGEILYHVAKWNGSGWSPLGYGVDHFVFALAASGNDVYVGGRFAQVCGSEDCTGNTRVNHIARWNGTAWSGLGNGVSSDVWALALRDADLYVGGSFTRVCGSLSCDTGNTTVNRTAKWSNSSWSPLGDGVLHQVDGTVFSLAVSANAVVAGGTFTQLCGNTACNNDNTPANHIAQWNGSAWSPVGNGVDDQVFSVAVGNSVVYAGGWFTQGCNNAACSGARVMVNRVAQYAPSAPPTVTPTATSTAVCAHAPNKPVLQSPANNGTTNKKRPTLSWQAATCANTYTIVLKEAATGAQVTQQAGLTGLSFKTKALTAGKSYKWSVKACNAHGCTKSATWKFKVK